MGERPTIRDMEAPWPDRVAASSTEEAETSRQRARRMRQNLTPPELYLWVRLRGRQLMGLKFRRQHPLGPYFADFYCHELGLVIEVDGLVHKARREHDAARDRWMREHGLTVVRLSASLVMSDIGAAVDLIAGAARRLLDQRAAEQGRPK